MNIKNEKTDTMRQHNENIQINFPADMFRVFTGERNGMDLLLERL